MSSINPLEKIKRFGKFKLGHKMGIGFGLMIIGAAIISLAASVSLDRFKGNVLVADEANTVASLSQKADRLLRTYIVTHDEDTALKNAADISSAFEGLFGSMEKRLSDKEEKDLLDKMKETSRQFWLGFKEYITLDKDNRALRNRWEESGGRISEQLNKLSKETVESGLSEAKQKQDYIAMQEWGELDSDLKKGVVQPFLEIRIASDFFKNSPNEESWTNLNRLMTTLNEGLGKWLELVEYQGKEGLKEPSLNIQQGIKQFSELAIGFKKSLEYLDKTGKILISSANKLLSLANSIAKKKKEAMLSLISKTVALIFALAIIGVAVGVLLAYFITRSITKPIKRIIHRMTMGSEDVGTASRQLSEVSHSFADHASEQAASLEETSSSLEEMSSMTRQNADHATEADNLMKEANRIAGMANESMDQLTTSMGDISNASEETSKIVKNIDEIAFQTNLLALNAAVEAARAGDAGAGFAVVADEVRNLALRAAEAAKQTEQLIESTLKKVNEGSNLVEKTGGVFSQVADSVKKVGDLVGEIATASDDQASGIDQVNKTVAEMDRVTQENAANAEEATATSEHLRSQAEQMKIIVEELVDLVGNIRRRSSEDQATNRIQAEKPDKTPSNSVSEKNADQIETSSLNREKSVSPDKVIPLDDDFEDF